MRSPKVSDAYMLDMTKSVIQLYFNKETDSLSEHISDDFVCIGDRDNLFIRGKSEFLKALTEQDDRSSVSITEEEYSVLTNNRRIWVTYGRCVVCSEKEELACNAVKYHLNCVWSFKGETPFLTELVAFRVGEERDGDNSQSRDFKDTLRYRQTIWESSVAKKEKIAFKEWHKPETFYLMPSEILYIKANNKRSIVHTIDKTILTGFTIGKLAESTDFVRIHKSYLVNGIYVAKLRRNVVTLTDGTELPISRAMYGELKKIFRDRCGEE